MNTNIISYSLYDQKNKVFDRSGHDSFCKEQFRYWTNIPFLYIINSIYFNNFTTKFYVHNDIKNHQLYPLLDELSKLENFQLEFMDKEQMQTSPSLWRLKCVWDEKSDICFCRDADSILTPIEAKCMKFFIENDNYWLNNIRGSYCHNFEGTILMAGLCGFKSNILKRELPLTNNFDDYLKFCSVNYNTKWGSDQCNLIDFFIKSRTQRIISKLLDFYIQPKVDITNDGPVVKSNYFNINSFGDETLKDFKLNINNEILNLTESITNWLGQPVDVRGEKLNTLLSFNYDKCKKVKDMLNSNSLLKIYYKVN